MIQTLNEAISGVQKNWQMMSNLGINMSCEDGTEVCRATPWPLYLNTTYNKILCVSAIRLELVIE